MAFYNHHYGHYCYLPLPVFEAGSGALSTAALRPGERPTGAGNATIMKRVLRVLRQHWPRTHIPLRGDGHFPDPELMQLTLDDGDAGFIFGPGGNLVLTRKAEGLMGGRTRASCTASVVGQTRSGACRGGDAPVRRARVRRVVSVSSFSRGAQSRGAGGA